MLLTRPSQVNGLCFAPSYSVDSFFRSDLVKGCFSNFQLSSEEGMIPKMSSLSLFWYSRQRAVQVNSELVRTLVEKAIPWCLEQPRWSTSTLPETIEITFLNDRAIAKVHADFCHDPSPTDVITFRHSPSLGEILVGIPTVARYAREFQQLIDHEVALCVIHGLLHLLDYDDTTPEERVLMHRRQDALLQQALKSLS